jgi:F1F0 ATPase subunit 2
MNEMLTLALSLAAGVLLGGIFFGGLWWTVRKGVSSRRPVLWFLGSLLLRTAIVLAGFFVVADGHWDRMVACLIGFVCARFIVTRITPSPVESSNTPRREAIDAAGPR